jgi:hypothetical protein
VEAGPARVARPAHSESLSVPVTVTGHAGPIRAGSGWQTRNHDGRDNGGRLPGSAAKYSLNPASLKKIMDSDPDERSAFIIGLANNAQQVIRYSLYGKTIKFLCDKVLTPRDVHPSDEVKLHLGLTGENARKRFMNIFQDI